MKVISLLEEAAVLEDVVASCYGVLSDRAASPRLTEDFKQLEREENNHARVIRTGKNYVLNAPDQFGKANFDIADIHTGLSAVHTILEDLKSGKSPFREAVVRMREIEARFERIHLATLVTLKDETLGGLFRQLSRDDRDHSEKLDEILKNLD